MTDENNQRTDYDREIDEAFELLTDDETDAFLLQTITDGDLDGVMGLNRWFRDACHMEDLNGNNGIPYTLVARQLQVIGYATNTSPFTALEYTMEMLKKMEGKTE